MKNLRTLLPTALALIGLTATIAFGSMALAAEKMFGGRCAMSVAKGTPVPTDCSIFWISPDDKLYCFVSVEARDTFVANSPRNEKLADAFWRDPAFWEQLRQQQ